MMTRAALVIAVAVGMALVWTVPVMPVVAEPGFGWGRAQRIETGTGDAALPQVAVDSQGNVIAVWQQSDGILYDIWANRFVPGVGWGTAELIETGTGDAALPQVAVDPQGNAIAVWRQSDGTRLDIWANRYVPGTGWGTAERIETGTGDAHTPQVAVDPQGNAIVVWRQWDGARWDIWANHFLPGVEWGTAERIETGEGYAEWPQVAVDSQGNAIAVWRQQNGTRWDVWANRYVPGTGWGAAVLVETNNTDSAWRPELTMDPAGNAFAVWHQSDGTRTDIWANRFMPGTGWGAAVLVETNNTDSAWRPELTMDPAGNAFAVWHQSDGTRWDVWANRYVLGTGWGTAERIETGTGDAQSPQIAVDPQGNAIAVWQQSDGTRWDVWANRFVPGVGWGTAEPIEAGAYDAILPQITVDSQGNATAVWPQLDGTRLDIWANRFVPGTGWGTAELIETEAGDSWGSQVAVDPQGNVIVVWQMWDGNRTAIWANRYVPGTGWGTAQRIETGAGPFDDASWPQIAVDPQGNAIAVWQQWDRSAPRRDIWANRFMPGTGWGTAERIETETGDADMPQVAVDSRGNATAVWYQSADIWANRFVPGVGWGTAQRIETEAGPAAIPQVAVDPQGNVIVAWQQWDSTGYDIWANRLAEDIVPPKVVITSPVDGEMLTSTVVTVTGTASDAVRLNRVELSTDGLTWVLAMGSTSWSGTVTLAEGPNTIYARATDTAGNTALDSVSVTVASPPTAPLNLQATAGDAKVDLTWAPPLYDGGSAITAYNVHRGTSSGGETFLTAVGNVLTYTDTSVSNGVNYYFQVSAVNTVGEGARSNEANATPMAPDTANPTITITSPANGSSLASTSITVSGTALDDVAVERVELSTDGMTWVLAMGTTSWSGTVTLAAGPNTIYARATDTAGNKVTVSIAVTCDTAEPSVAIISPTDGAALNSKSVVVSGTASDNEAVEMVELSTDGTDWVLTTGTASWSGNLTLAEGPNTIYARATDRAGNAANVSIAVIVDTIQPTANAGEDRTVSVGATVSFDASGSSDNVAIVSYEWDFGDGTSGTGEMTTHIYRDPGTYTVTLTTRDAAGNIGTDSVTVSVEAEPFQISPLVVTLAIVGVVAAVAGVAVFVLWRRRVGGKEKA